MNIEYRYKQTFLNKYFPMFLIFLLTAVFVFSMIDFIHQNAYEYIIMYAVMYGFFAYEYRYLFVIYYLNRPALVLTEELFVYHSPLGLKTIPYTEISKIEERKRMGMKYLFVQSENNAPLSIRIGKMDQDSTTIKDQIMSLYNQNRG